MYRYGVRPKLWLAVIVTCAAPVLAGPAIEIAPGTFNFGKTMQHSTVTHTFWVRSTGDAPLKITEVVPGCGCTRAPLKDSLLAPGDSTSLEIIFSTRSFTGQVHKRPYLLTNASDDKIYIDIKAEVLSDAKTMHPLRLTPYPVDIPHNPGRQNQRALFLIENVGDRAVVLRVIDQPSATFQVTLPDKIEPGQTAEGVVTVAKESAGIEFNRSFSFDIVENPRIRYTVPVRRILPAPQEPATGN
ncbi:MAG: DUF1573 domain-containing protein [Candidatus Zixiibacteriota bacterium]|nr:MAG: DUF1573 domain-containing protein [candidate division Zixibacteria bacterium]